MSKLENRLIKFTLTLVRCVRKSRVPLFSHKKSKHTYKQYQHIAVLGLMKYLKCTYRRVIEQLDLMPELARLIDLYRLPHFTTIQKFLQRFNRFLFDSLLSRTVELFKTGPYTLAIDASGYSSTQASRYYTWRTRQKRKSFLYSNIAIHTGNQVVISQRPKKNFGGENSYFQPLVRDAAKHKKIRYVLADKGYDCEYNHMWTDKKFGARCIIPVKQGRWGSVRTPYRKKLDKNFPEDIYHQRSLVETVFSSVKRLFGSCMQSRSITLQKKEIGLVYVCYNIHRYVLGLLVWMFSTRPFQ